MKKASSKKAGFKFAMLIITFVLIIFLVIFLGYKSVIKTLYPKKQATLVEKYATEYELDKALVYAVIKTESSFDENAKSNVGALGLTQIMPETFQWLQSKTGEQLEDKELYNADTSIKYGCLLLSMLMGEFQDTQTALAAYHAGRGSVNNWLKNPDYSKDGKVLDKIPTQDTAFYVHKVTKAISIYKNLYDI